MPIELACPQCGSRLKLPSEAAGRRVRCKTCKHVFRISHPPPQQQETSSNADEPPGSRGSASALTTYKHCLPAIFVYLTLAAMYLFALLAVIATDAAYLPMLPLATTFLILSLVSSKKLSSPQFGKVSLYRVFGVVIAAITAGIAGESVSVPLWFAIAIPILMIVACVIASLLLNNHPPPDVAYLFRVRFSHRHLKPVLGSLILMPVLVSVLWSVRASWPHAEKLAAQQQAIVEQREQREKAQQRRIADRIAALIPPIQKTYLAGKRRLEEQTKYDPKRSDFERQAAYDKLEDYLARQFPRSLNGWYGRINYARPVDYVLGGRAAAIEILCSERPQGGESIVIYNAVEVGNKYVCELTPKNKPGLWKTVQSLKSGNSVVFSATNCAWRVEDDDYPELRQIVCDIAAIEIAE